MATTEYWAEAVIVREQRTMFAPTLDDMIDEDHEVRLLDEALRKLDWTEWEDVYKRERGQPPIHPRVIAGLWLYGMMRRIRTSRFLEYACRHNIDFIWLAEGHTPDRSKLAELDLQIEAMMNDVAAAETAAGDSGGTTLPESLATSKQRRDKLSEKLEAVRAKDEARKKDGVNPDSDRTLRVETVRLFKLRSCQIVLLCGSNCRV